MEPEMVSRKPSGRLGSGLVVGTFLVLVGASLQAQKAVMPGHSLARIEIGMPRADVWRRFGKPTEIRHLRFADLSYVWDDWQDGRRRETVISRQGRVAQIEHRVMFGDKPAGTFQSLRGRHPPLRATLYDLREETGSVLLVDDARQGTAWTLYIHYKNGFGTHLLNEVGPDMVITHRPGRAALPDAAETPNEHDPLIHDIRAWFAARPPKQKKHERNNDGKSL